MSDFFIELDENRKEEINEQFLRYQEENRIKDEDKLFSFELSKKLKQIPNYLLKKSRKLKRLNNGNNKTKDSEKNTKKNRLENENYLLLNNLNRYPEETEYETVRSLKNLMKKKYEMGLKTYCELESRYYSETIRGEENYMEATISKINEFSRKKKFPEYYAEKEEREEREKELIYGSAYNYDLDLGGNGNKIGNLNLNFNFTTPAQKKEKNFMKEGFFFITSYDGEKKESVCNYLKNVPYVCPFPSCNRKFFNLKNLEQHKH